ncbi:MAG: hypothetical protein CM15mP21_5380 [Hyphomicrobiales bacterium]|nr:MAG: hypothetical protein CM15mP21_5380 [Hyphomicrobiales bacterium]
MRAFAKQIRDGLLERGIDKINLEGYRDEEIWIEAHAAQLRRYALTPDEIAARIAGSSWMCRRCAARRCERQVRAVGLALTAEEVGAIVCVTLLTDGNFR